MNEQVVALLSADLVASLGWASADAERHARREARRMAEFDGDAIRIAEEVQQWLHDTFLDTTWPSCPDHHVHPLWLEEGHGRPVWTCHATGMGLCPLGELGAIISIDAETASENRQRLLAEEQYVERMVQRLGRPLRKRPPKSPSRDC